MQSIYNQKNKKQDYIYYELKKTNLNHKKAKISSGSS